MKVRTEQGGPETPLSPAQIAADDKLEAFLDEVLASPSAGSLPEDFTVRILAARPFAPWEVRRPSAWKAPFLVLAALLFASAGAFVLPLLSLGPGTAIALWAWATLGAFTRPVLALAAAVRLLPEAGAIVGRAVPAPLALGAGALVSAAAMGLLALRPGRRTARAARG